MTRRFSLAFALLLLPVAGLQAADSSFDSNGVKIQFSDEGKGEPVVLVHGFAANRQIQWVLPGIAKELAKSYRVIVLDNRGHGQSGKPHDPKQYGAEMVADILRLLDHLQIKRAHVVGYSMGAFLTLKLVESHPDRVLSATLGGAGRNVPGDDRFIDELAEALLNGKGFAPLLNRLTPVGRQRLSDSEVKFRSNMITLMNDTKALAAAVKSWRELLVAEEKLKVNKVPTLALIGSIDPLKEGVDLLQKQMANLTVVTIDGGDHFNTFTRPEFLKDLKAFLGKHAQKD